MPLIVEMSSGESWQIMGASINLLPLYNNFMLARVDDKDEMTFSFPISSRVKQGCVLASTLFNIMFSTIQTDAFRDTDVGTGIY